jgi:hypothetical protein
VGAVDDDEWLHAEHLESARHAHRAHRRVENLTVDLRVEELLDGDECRDGIVTLVTSVQRNGHLGIQRL